jgi:hypothetical protein
MANKHLALKTIDRIIHGKMTVSKMMHAKMPLAKITHGKETLGFKDS